jgi:hypothetical protein
MEYSRIEKAIASWYESLGEQTPYFSNWELLTRTLEAVRLIAQSENLTSADTDALKTAMMLAFYAYVGENRDNPISAALQKADELLPANGYSEAESAQVKALITGFFNDPSNLHEQIMSDAFFAYLASDSYFTDQHNYKREMAQHGKVYDLRAWYERELNFLTNEHRYYTNYALSHYEPKKQYHISEIKKLLGHSL